MSNPLQSSGSHGKLSLLLFFRGPQLGHVMFALVPGVWAECGL